MTTDQDMDASRRVGKEHLDGIRKCLESLPEGVMKRQGPRHLDVPLVLVLWIASGVALAAITTRVTDWFVMTDELLYERLAISIYRLGSLIPHVHGEVVPNLNQLYPALLAVPFRNDSVRQCLHDAHLLNAFVMTSACVPAYLITRRVTESRSAPWIVAVLSITLPWIALASFLLTEVVAYPIFLWAIVLCQQALVQPRARNDAAALAAIGLAVLARTQFAVFALVLVLAIVGLALTTSGRGSRIAGLRAAARAHAVLLVAYLVVAAIALVLVLAGHSPLGSYSQTAKGNIFPSNILQSAAEHLAVISLASGILPLLVGGAWMLSNLRHASSTERHAFAWLSTTMVVVLTLEVASFNIRFGGGIVRERYLFYLVPLLLAALAAALTDLRVPRWSLAVPLAVLSLGLVATPIVVYEKYNVDTPASLLNNWLIGTLHTVGAVRVFLIVAVFVVAILYVEGVFVLGQKRAAIALAALLLVALPAETAYAFKRLFAVNGTSGLPMTLDQSVVFGWADRVITPNSETMMVPYPLLRTDYWADVAFWWDLEFWNRSVTREGGTPGVFEGTPPGTFPKIALSFDPTTGRANVDFDSYVTQAVGDARFHIAGRQLSVQRDATMVFPERPWRADWVTRGLYVDGWTVPGRTARIRVFARPRRTTPELRSLTVSMRAPDGVQSRSVHFVSDVGEATVSVVPGTVLQQVTVCVPPGRPADVRINAAGSSPISGSEATPLTAVTPRNAGVLVQAIELSDAAGPACHP
jgi:hypothetical protein